MDDGGAAALQVNQSSAPSILDIPSFCSSHFMRSTHIPEGMKRPPSHPNHHLPRSASQNLSPLPSHSRSLTPREASYVSMEESPVPPRRGHRRSSSDIPLGFNAMIQSSPQLIPIGSRQVSDVHNPFQLVKSESLGDKGDLVDDLFNAYMNLDNLDALNSSATEDKDMDSTKTNGGDNSDNEVESRRVNGHTNGVKRSAGGDIAPASRHYRSLSMDSFMGNLHFDDESSKLHPLAGRLGHHSPSSSMDGNSTKFNMELANGEFSGSELQKIMANEKLAEIALSDSKRAKRILANRQSAARSKERKMRYIVELEHKVQTLQTEATTLSAQLTMLQRDSTGLTSENNELKFRLQSIEQQAKLKDALNEALSAEVRHLKAVIAEYGGETHLSNCMAQQLSINQQIYQVQNQRSNQLNIYQLQQQHDHDAQVAKHE